MLAVPSHRVPFQSKTVISRGYRGLEGPQGRDISRGDKKVSSQNFEIWILRKLSNLFKNLKIFKDLKIRKIQKSLTKHVHNISADHTRSS